jgi:hypothetical protein
MQKSPALFYTPLTMPVLLIAALLPANMSVAAQVYKSTNAQGEVVYSDEPPPNAVNVEQVEIQPAPTEAEHREGVERAKRMDSMADEMGTARQERDTQPARGEPQPAAEQPVEVYTNGDYVEERRRRAIAGERRPHVEHRVPARAVPHAGGGGRR